MKEVVLIILMSILSLILYADEITLFDCIDDALVNSYDIKEAQNDIAIYRSRKYLNLFDFVPNIAANVDASRDIYGNEIGTNYFSISEDLHLFDQRFSNYELSGLHLQFEEYNYLKQIQDSVLEIIRLYSEIVILKESLVYYSNSTEFHINEIVFVRQMMKAGKRTELDLYSAQIELKNAELTITETRNKIKSKLLELSHKTGKEFSNEVIFAEISNLHLTEIGNGVFSNNLELKMSNIIVKQKKIEKNDYFKRIIPDLYLSGNYNIQYNKYWNDANQMYDSEGNFINRDQESRYWEISLNLSYSLGSLAQRLTNYSIGKLILKQEQLNICSLEMQLQQDIASKKLNLELIQDKIEINTQKLALSQRKLTLSQEQYRSGLISFLEYITAYNESIQVKIELLESKHELIIEFAEWQALNGRKIFKKY